MILTYQHFQMMWSPIKNPQYRIFHEQAKKVHFPYFESIKLNQKIKSITATNPYQVKIDLFEPDASILSHLASQYSIIFSQEYAYQLSADDNLTQLDTHPVARALIKWKITFITNMFAWYAMKLIGKRKPKFENIIVDLSADRTGRLIKISLIMNVKSRLIPKSANSAC